jgi:hypothetical protein
VTLSLRTALVGVVVLGALTGCGDPDAAPAASDGAAAALPFGLVRCPDERDTVAAAPDQYRDEPVYVSNEMPVDAVRTWAAEQPGFEEVWIDRDHNGWITVGFSEGAEARQAELAEAFPDVGVVAVGLDWTAAELMALRDDAFERLVEAGGEPGGGVSVPAGLVSVWVGELTEENLEPLAPLAGPRLCVEGVETADMVAEGPQPVEGEGWRLLGRDHTGEAYRTGVATTPAQYEALWGASGVPGEAPPVDFQDEIVIWFGAVYGSSCPIRMDDVVFDTAQGVVHGEFVVPGSPQACTDDANPEAYVVAVERDHLPEGPFAVQLDADEPPSGVPEERTLVAVDLRAPGSVAPHAQSGPDPALIDRADDGYEVAAGGIVEDGYPAQYRLDLGCTFDRIGPINDVLWQSSTPDLSAHPPAAWTSIADDGVVPTELLLETDPPRLSLRANGHTEAYVPGPDGTTDCP